MSERNYTWVEEISISGLEGYSSGGQPLEWLSGLKPITLFVGPTCSGKSRMLRYLASLDDPEVRWSGPVSAEIASDVRKVGTAATRAMGGLDRTSHHYGTLEYTAKSLLDSGPASRTVAAAGWVHSTERYGGLLNVETERLLKTYGLNNCFDVIEPVQVAFEAASARAREVEARRGPEEHSRFYESTMRRTRRYVPPIRGFWAANTGIQKSLEKWMIEQHFGELGGGQSPPVLWAGSAVLDDFYEHELEQTREERRVYFQDFLKSRVLGDGVELSFPDPAGEPRISIGGGPERPLSQQGDGVGHLVALLWPMFFGPNRVFFIDEPELGLHPGHQRTFFRALLKLREDSMEPGYGQQYFIVTHSNHLLDLADQSPSAAVKHFRQVRDGKFEIQDVSWGDRPLLRDLGVSLGACYLVNSTFFVEGITDRLVYEHILRLVQQAKEGDRFVEGVDYAFVEYGGANLPHWSFLDEADTIDVDSLCGQAMLFIDKDNADWKIERSKKLKQALGERLVETPGRELENLMPPSVLHEFARSRNVKLESSLSRSDYRDEALGRFLEGRELSAVALESGTLKTDHKKKLAALFRKHVAGPDELDKEVREIGRRMLKFLQDSSI